MKPIYLVTLFFLILIITIIVLVDSGNTPKLIETIYDFPNGDKIGHFFLMGIFAALVNLSLDCRTIKTVSKKILLGSLIVFIIVALEELSQSFFASRTASFVDLGFSLFGILTVGSIPHWITKNPSWI